MEGSQEDRALHLGSMEVPLVGSDAIKWIHITVPSEIAASSAVAPQGGRCPPPQDCAGTASVSMPSVRNFIWRVHEASPCVLELVELSKDYESLKIGLQLFFEEPLSPFASLIVDQVNNKEWSLCVLVVTVSGTAYIVRVKEYFSYQSSSVLAESDFSQFSLFSELARPDQITALAAAAKTLCIGGQNGSIICYPLKQIKDVVKGFSFELKDGDARFGYLWGLVTRSKSACPIKSLSIQTIQGRAVVFALHEDGTFKTWDLASHCRLFSCNISNAELTGYVPKRMWVEEPPPNAESVQVAFLLGRLLENSQDTIQVSSINISQGDVGMRQSLMTPHLVLPCMQGKVIDVKFLEDICWVLQDLGTGLFRLFHKNIKMSETPKCCRLLEEEVGDRLLQGPHIDWDDLMLVRQLIYPGVMEETALPLAEFFLPRLLQPGVLQRSLLRDLLESHKRRISGPDFNILTKEGLCKEVLAAIEAESIGDNELQLVHKWKTFCNDYFVLWKNSNVPYGFLLDCSTGGIGLIRRNSFSVVCSLGSVEQFYYDGEASEQVLQMDRKESFNEQAVLAALHSCMADISKHFGKMALSVFYQALLGPRHVSLPHLTSSFLRVLDVGYNTSIFARGNSHLGVDIARKKEQDQHRKQRKFELHMALALQALRNATGSWEKVLSIIEKYVEYFMLNMKVPMAKTTSRVSVYGSLNRKLVTKASCQVSRAYFEAAGDLLLLLGYIVNSKGQVGMSPNEVSKIQLHLIPQVREVLMVNLLLNWLTTSFADLPPAEDFSSRLSSLHIDGISKRKRWDERLGTSELTLAEILLSALLSTSVVAPVLDYGGLMNPDELLVNARTFIRLLIWGDTDDKLSLFSGRAIALATILLQHGQYAVLQDFLTTIEDFSTEKQLTGCAHNMDSEWSARLHLLGFCLLARARTSLKNTLKELQVGEAIRCFFRAASGLGEAKEVLQAVFLHSGIDTTLTGLGTAAAWKLHYFEWVMQIFEQYNFCEGACQFAHAALEQVDEAVGAFNNENPETQNVDILAITIKGRLWANVFKFSLDLELYKDAYCAIVSNPDTESKYICLRRFIIVLCERKGTEVLCGNELPYVGLLERVEQELVWKAEYSDISAKPNPYKLLYSFHMHRHNWRRAATYMYRYSLRMKGEGISKAHLQVHSALQEQLYGLAASINALHLVDPSYAWIDTQSEVKSLLSFQSPTKRLRVYAENESSIVPQRTGMKNHHIVGIPELEKEYTLILAQLQLANARIKHASLGGEMTASDLLLLLVQAGLYEMAFSVLFQFWKDSSVKRELEKMFRIMAEKCCSQQFQMGSASSIVPSVESTKGLLLLTSSTEVDSSLTIPTRNNHVVEQSGTSGRSNWQSLQFYLEKYKNVHACLPAIVAETILSVDRLMELPVWLVEMFKGGRHVTAQGMAGQGADPAALLCIYLDFGYFAEATSLLLDYMHAWSNMSPVDVIKRKQMCAVWFPYTLVDRLKLHLSELRSSTKYESLHKLLDSSLHRHLKQMQVDSDDVASLVKV